MSIFRNGATWVLLSAIALFFLSDAVLGTPLNRDVVDVAGMFFATLMALRLLPHVIEKFREGGGRQVGLLQMSNFLFYSGWAIFSAWAFLYRGLQRPEWMAESAVNGFLRFWILGAGLLAFFSTSEIPAPFAPTKVYYIAIGVLAGILIGVAGSQFFVNSGLAASLRG